MIGINLLAVRRVQPFSLFRRPTSQSQASPQEQVAPVLPARPLLWKLNFAPLQWLLDPGKELSKVNRVLAELVRASAHEANPHFRDDYQITWIAIYTADVKGEFDNGWDALVAASGVVIGRHPDLVWPSIVARRKADLGQEYSKWYDENDLPLLPERGLGGSHSPAESARNHFSLSANIPKKPSISVTRTRKEEDHAA